MKAIIKPTNTKPIASSEPTLGYLLSHSDDEFYSGLQRVWNRVSADLGTDVSSQTTGVQKQNRPVRVK